MATNTVDIQNNLSQLHVRWKSYSANEKTGYINFLTELLACFGVQFNDPNDLPFEKNTGKGFADLYIKNVVIIEMKDKNKIRNRNELKEQLPQALKYWEGTGKHVPFLVLCNFSDFIIYDTRDATIHHLKLADLENKVESFNFLLRLNPKFAPDQEAVTRESAKLMGKLYRSLKARHKGQAEEVDIFVLQCLFCLFSEDIGYLPTQTFTNCVRRIIDGEDSSSYILSTLFKMMDERDTERKKGRFENVRYFNGPLFRIKPEIVLNDEEVTYLWESCQLDWKNVKPEIFGALFEASQSKKDRHKDGMHFTSEEDILKVIKPCILDPWNEKLEKCRTMFDYLDLHKKLKSYRIMDPACGSGNFLVVAYREIKALEAKIFMEYKRLSGDSYIQVQQALGWFPVTNMYGIELNPFPSFLTRVSLWITKKMIRNQYKLIEPDLPLEELKHIIAADALEVKWDDVDVVVGNPPYIGCKMIRQARGDKYFSWLGSRFANHNKMSDYCTYWFEKILEDVKPNTRVGLVCTKTISQTNSRIASLDKVIESGGTIFNAVSNQKWSGEAKVHVSIVNFMNRSSYKGEKILNGKSVPTISSRLLGFDSRDEPQKISVNLNKAFQGITTLGKGFFLTEEIVKKLISKDKRNSKVIKNFFSASSVVDDPLNRSSEWIIDFQDWPLEKAREYGDVLKILESQIENEKKKCGKRKKIRSESNKNWWRHWRTRSELRKAISNLKRYVLVSRHTKYPLFVFADAKSSLPEDSCVAIAIEDYGQLGVLQSKFHTDWFNYQCSSLKSDARYTNTTVFETFPFPEKIANDVGRTMESIEKYRKSACSKQKIGLTDLYNQMQEGGHDILRKLHKQLDAAVAKCYAFPSDKISDYKYLIEFLISKNLEQSGSFSFAPSKVVGEIESPTLKRVETKISFSALSKIPTKTNFDKVLERRLALANLITFNLSNDKNLGRTKFAKVFYVCDEESNLDLKTEYVREAAGPLDQRALYNEKVGLESLGQKYGLFTVLGGSQKGDKIKYTIGPHAETFLRSANNLIGASGERIKNVISIFAPLNTEQSEIVATLYACWNDLLISSRQATTDEIINEFRNKWHPKKKRFDADRLKSALDWMKMKGLIPKAKGKMTKKRGLTLPIDEEIPF